MYVNGGVDGFREEAINRMSTNIAASGAGMQTSGGGLPSFNDVVGAGGGGAVPRIPKFVLVGGGIAAGALILWLILRKKKST